MDPPPHVQVEMEELETNYVGKTRQMVRSLVR